MITQPNQIEIAHPHTDTSEIQTRRSLPFPLGYTEHVWCRGTNFQGNETGAITCTLHNADGSIDAYIRRPDVDVSRFHDWIILRIDVVSTAAKGEPVAEILNVHRSWPVWTSYLDLLPRAACALPAKLDEFRHLVGCIQTTVLRQIIESVLSDPTVYLPFLTRFAGSDSYTYPSGLLAKTVDAAKLAIKMGFHTQEEADIVLAATLLYDIGRIRDGNLVSERLRDLIGFLPHPKSKTVVGAAVDPARSELDRALAEILTTGYCDRYPTLHPKLKQETSLAKIDRQIRTGSENSFQFKLADVEGSLGK